MIVNLPVFIEGRILRLQAERIYFNLEIERFRIIGHDRAIIVECDLPATKSRKRHLDSVKWKIIEGQIKDQETFEQVLSALELKSRAGGFDDLPSIDEI
jgi:hypothetical protein